MRRRRWDDDATPVMVIPILMYWFVWFLFHGFSEWTNLP